MVKVAVSQDPAVPAGQLVSVGLALKVARAEVSADASWLTDDAPTRLSIEASTPKAAFDDVLQSNVICVVPAVTPRMSEPTAVPEPALTLIAHGVALAVVAVVAADAAVVDANVSPVAAKDTPATSDTIEDNVRRHRRPASVLRALCFMYVPTPLSVIDTDTTPTHAVASSLVYHPPLRVARAHRCANLRDGGATIITSPPVASARVTRACRARDERRCRGDAPRRPVAPPPRRPTSSIPPRRLDRGRCAVASEALREGEEDLLEGTHVVQRRRVTLSESLVAQ